MPARASKYGLLALKALLALAFGAAGLAKLAGVEMMVGTFETIGVGQWFRYLTGVIEVGSAILLWVPGVQLLGAALLTATMVGAALAHVFILGPSVVPALVLGLLSATVAVAHRDQVARYEQMARSTLLRDGAGGSAPVEPS